MRSCVVLPFPGNEACAASLARALGADLGALTLRAFPDGETETSRSPRRVFVSTTCGQAARAATSATHCSLSASGPTTIGRSTCAEIHAASAGAERTVRDGIVKTSSSDRSRCRCGSTVTSPSKCAETRRA